MPLETDKRQRTRVPVDARVVLHAENKSLFLDGVTRDISMRGLFAKIDVGFPVGMKCQIEVVLEGVSSELVMKMDGTIVRREDGGCGVLFDNDLEWWPIFAIHIAHREAATGIFLEEDLKGLDD